MIYADNNVYSKAANTNMYINRAVILYIVNFN